MKTGVCIIATIIYSLAIIVYLHYQSDDSIAYGLRKEMFYVPTTSMLMFYKIIRYDRHQPSEICLDALIGTFIIITLNYAGLISNTYNILYTFFALIIAISSVVLIWRRIRGYFKHKQ